MALSCLNDVNISLRKHHQEVLDINKRKLSLQNTGMDKGGDFHLQLYASSPAPKRDYHGLTISNLEIILNSWDISRGTHVYPRRKRVSLEDFLVDKWLRSEIEFLFGNHVIIYIDRLANKDRSIFCLSEKIVRTIIDFLAVKDILHLKQSSKIFFELCNTNEIWKILFRKIQKRPPNSTEIKQAELGLTWCHILQTRINDIHERKTIYHKYKKGVEALHRQNHEIGDHIRNTVKKQSTDNWKRSAPDPTNENILPNQIKIKTYKEGASSTTKLKSSTMKPIPLTTKSVPSTIKPVSSTTRPTSSVLSTSRSTSSVLKVEETQQKRKPSAKKNDLKSVINTTTSQSLLKKRIESKKSIETLNEMKKVTFTQTTKTANAKTDSAKTANSAENKSNTKTNKIAKNNQNLKSKTFIA